MSDTTHTIATHLIDQLEALLKETASRDLYSSDELQDWLLDTLNIARKLESSA